MNTDHRGIGMTSQRTRDRLCQQLREMGVESAAVLQVIRNTPRHIFIDEALASRAYENTALPIGFGQTISQPYIVARMTELLVNSGPLNKVLEIGSGCGYQTAVLSHFARTIYSIERIEALLKRMREHIRALRILNVHARHGDGFEGWPQLAPFDAILVAAAPAEVPQALLRQLAPGGRLIIPVGHDGEQQLRLITRSPEGLTEEILDRVSFVPLLEGRS